MRLLISIGLLALLTACGSMSSSKEPGRVMIVDRNGTPLANGVLVPDEENPPPVPHVYDDYELKERASDASGVFHVSLEDCIWSSDGCYHFRIHRTGFDDSTMTVSKDLFPPMLKVTMVEKGSDAAPPGTH